jgi:putative transposase
MQQAHAMHKTKPIRRGVLRSTRQLENDIRSFVDAHNAAPKSIRWTKSDDSILAAIQRLCQRTHQIGGINESGH